MTRSGFPEAHRFDFELRLEVSSVLSFSAGELCHLVLEALFSLDEQSALFPGVTTPDTGNRLLSARMGAIGYGRTGAAAPIGEAYRRLVLAPKGASRSARNLEHRLVDAMSALATATLQLHMLQAKLRGLADKCRHRGAITDADRTIAEGLIAAAVSFCTTVSDSVLPVL